MVWKMASIEVHKQPPRIATSFYCVKAYCTQRDSSLSIRPALFFFFSPFQVRALVFSARARMMVRQNSDLQINNELWFQRGATFSPPFPRPAESAQGGVGRPAHQRGGLIRLQSLELCYTEGSSGGFFVLPFFFFIFSRSLWCIINQPSFFSNEIVQFLSGGNSWTEMAQNRASGAAGLKETWTFCNISLTAVELMHKSMSVPTKSHYFRQMVRLQSDSRLLDLIIFSSQSSL